MGLYWTPSPSVSLQLDETQDDGEPRAGPVWIRLPDTRGTLEGLVRWHTFTADLGDPPSITGVPYIGQGSILGGELGGGRLRSVQFGIVNLPTLGETKTASVTWQTWGVLDSPLLLTGSGWRVTIEAIALDGADHPGFDGSSWATHIGLAHRASGKTFWPSQAHMVMGGLRSLLTFSRGAQTGSGLAVALDGDGHHQWSLWEWEDSERLLGTDFPTGSWLGEDHAGALKAVFPSWMEMWSDDRLRPRLDLAVALRADAAIRRPDAGVVVGQQALEQLAWSLLQSTKDLDKLRASDRLRNALHAGGTRPYLPPSLQQIANEQGWDDGAHAITAIRNSLVHPTPANELPAFILEAMDDWRDLVLSYIDRLVLAVIGYAP